MSNLPYHLAAQRADRAMERIELYVLCPVCVQPAACVVDGTDVTIADCADTDDQCYGEGRISRITSDALHIAASRREDYTQHLREGGN